MHTISRQLAVTLLVLSVVAAAFFIPSSFSQVTSPSPSIQEASLVFDEAFTAVLSAEKAGANVTALLSQLNVAAAGLASAENSYLSEDYTMAITQANSVLSVAQQVKTDALSYEQAASANHNNAFWFSVAFAIAIAFVFNLLLFLLWRNIKQKHICKLLKSKPKVAETEA
ncbi:MAG: hypothetical protein NWE93_10685 [Candidatus Bathyarchaeota archaeon]|nr:hypothetical protein [Candidatus Bathyarchaeota archaeon]